MLLNLNFHSIKVLIGTLLMAKILALNQFQFTQSLTSVEQLNASTSGWYTHFRESTIIDCYGNGYEFSKTKLAF